MKILKEQVEGLTQLESSNLKGGWRSVQTAADMEAIPEQNREEGMRVYIVETDETYQYRISSDGTGQFMEIVNFRPISQDELNDIFSGEETTNAEEQASEEIPEEQGTDEELVSARKSVITGDGFKQVWNEITSRFAPKEEGKALSANDYTDEEKEKLRSVQVGAEVNDISQIKINVYNSATDEFDAPLSTVDAVVGNRVAEVRLNITEDLGLEEIEDEELDELIEAAKALAPS